MTERIAACENIITQTATMLDTSPNAWRSFLLAVRSVTTSLDSTDFMSRPQELNRQLHFIDVLQRFAFVEKDFGAVNDVADWCVRQLLSLEQRHPNNADILYRIAHHWNCKAPPALARLPENDGSCGSGTSEGQQGKSISTESDSLLDSAAYVEARGLLLPAVDYYARAVQVACSSGSLSVALLVEAAEANISLGTVSHPRVNERYFRLAIEYLRRASGIRGCALPAHLQQYLDEYGHLC